MHEISVLQKAVDLAEQTAIENNISRISYLTLEVGELSGYVPQFFSQVLSGRNREQTCI